MSENAQFSLSGREIGSQRVRLPSDISGETQNIGNGVLVSLDVLASQAVRSSRY
jgi:hypothetical protein